MKGIRKMVNLKKCAWKGIGVILLSAVLTGQAFASSLTVRDIKLLGQGKVEIDLDGTPTRGALEMDYVRDIVQFSIQNATIYPAKILHADSESEQNFSKVFAYQYAPNLVRVRFSVSGKAEQFQGKVKWEQKGKTLTVSFPTGILPEVKETKAAKKEDASEHERSLLAKVLGQKNNVKVEKLDEPKPEVKEEAKVEVKPESKAEVKVEAKAEPKHKLTGSAPQSTAKLGGANSGPSGLRSFLAMLLVVGGLGLVLVYVKRKKGSVQAKKVGESWISNLMSGGKKNKPLIEVLGIHPLGPKQSITIVRIRGQQLVLGVTEGNVQLITQLDSDEDFDILDDPKVADSIGKMFGAKPTIQAPAPKTVRPAPQTDASFNSMLKGSNGAGAIVARNAYQANQPTLAATPQVAPLQSSVRDQIKQRLQGMRNA